MPLRSKRPSAGTTSRRSSARSPASTSSTPSYPRRRAWSRPQWARGSSTARRRRRQRPRRLPRRPSPSRPPRLLRLATRSSGLAVGQRPSCVPARGSHRALRTQRWRLCAVVLVWWHRQSLNKSQVPSPKAQSSRAQCPWTRRLNRCGDTTAPSSTKSTRSRRG